MKLYDNEMLTLRDNL